MTLETFPAEDVHPVVANVHPSLLHVVRMGKGKRSSWLEPVPTKDHWRQKFEIRGDKVSVINKTSELDVEKDGVTKRKVPAKDVVTEIHDNTIILGGSKEHLNLVFLKPKQSNCDATITNVLAPSDQCPTDLDRILTEGQDPGAQQCLALGTVPIKGKTWGFGCPCIFCTRYRAHQEKNVFR